MSDVIVKENKKGGQVYYIYDNKELMPKKLLCEDGIAHLWDLVNNAESPDEIRRAEKAVSASDVDNKSYDEFMMALSFKSRELIETIRREAYQIFDSDEAL